MKKLLLLLTPLIVFASCANTEETPTVNRFDGSEYGFSFLLPEDSLDRLDEIQIYERENPNTNARIESRANLSFTLEDYSYHQLIVWEKGGASKYKPGVNEIDEDTLKWDLAPTQGTSSFWFSTSIFFGEHYDYELVTSHEDQSVSQKHHKVFTDGFEWEK